MVEIKTTYEEEFKETLMDEIMIRYEDDQKNLLMALIKGHLCFGCLNSDLKLEGYCLLHVMKIVCNLNLLTLNFTVCFSFYYIRMEARKKGTRVGQSLDYNSLIIFHELNYFHFSNSLNSVWLDWLSVGWQCSHPNRTRLYFTLVFLIPEDSNLAVVEHCHLID